TGDPLYVVSIDADKREVIVGPRAALARARIMLDEVNWIGGDDAIDLPVRVRIRSTGEPAHAALTLKENGAAEIVLAEAEEGVSPGQACVFYAADSDRVLGGGWISAATNS
ncbi:MAG: aminomethyltransferase beta-barrel domain-containing protein, partial [Parvibaculales bacterium]